MLCKKTITYICTFSHNFTNTWLYYGHLIIMHSLPCPWGKESCYIFSTFNPLYSDIPLIQTLSQPRSPGSLLPIPMERESWARENLVGCWTHSSRKKIILREEWPLSINYLSGLFSPFMLWLQEQDGLLTLHLLLKLGKFLPKKNYL